MYLLRIYFSQCLTSSTRRHFRQTPSHSSLKWKQPATHNSPKSTNAVRSRPVMVVHRLGLQDTLDLFLTRATCGQPVAATLSLFAAAGPLYSLRTNVYRRFAYLVIDELAQTITSGSSLLSRATATRCHCTTKYAINYSECQASSHARTHAHLSGRETCEKYIFFIS